MIKVRVFVILLAALPALAQNSSRFVQAELVTAVKTKTAAVGDTVKARVVSSVTLPDGRKLGRNAEIIGQVRALDATSVAISFDSADIDGKSTPIVLSIRAAMAPGGAQNTSAKTGSVIGMHGVTLEIDAGPDHATKFRSEGKNLQLKTGLQLMLAPAGN